MYLPLCQWFIRQKGRTWVELKSARGKVTAQLQQVRCTTIYRDESRISMKIWSTNCHTNKHKLTSRYALNQKHGRGTVINIPKNLSGIDICGHYHLRRKCNCWENGRQLEETGSPPIKTERIQTVKRNHVLA